MKKITKFVSCFMSLLLVVAAFPCKNVLANSMISREEKLKVLTDTGAPNEFIEKLSEAQINDYYAKFNGKNIVFKGTEDKIVNINENSRDNISPSTLKLSISYFEDRADYGGEVYGLIVDTHFEWLKRPFWSLKDGMTLNWDADHFNFQSLYAETGFMLNGTWYPKDEVTNAAKITNGGVAWFLDIDSGNLNQGGGSIYLVPRHTLYTWDDLNMQLSFTYAHQKNGVSISFGEIVGGCIDVSGGDHDSQAISTIYH